MSSGDTMWQRILFKTFAASLAMVGVLGVGEMFAHPETLSKGSTTFAFYSQGFAPEVTMFLLTLSLSCFALYLYGLQTYRTPLLREWQKRR